MGSRARRVGHVVNWPAPVPAVTDPGLAFGCTTEVAGVERQVTVTVVGLTGDLRYQVLPCQAARPLQVRGSLAAGAGGQPPSGGRRSRP
jgi:hypothetical protein